MKKIILLASLIFSINAFAQVPSYVPTNGLQGWWPFSGNVNDISANVNNGTINGSTLTNDRFGNNNAAYYFNGTSYISIPNITQYHFGTNNDFTINMWFKRALTSSSWQVLMSYACPDAGGTGGFQLGTQSNFNLELGSTVAEIFTNGNVNDTLWHMLTTTFNRTTDSVKVYQDGIYIGNIFVNNNQSYTPSCNPNILIGGERNFWSQYYFNGIIDDIGIWNRALTVCEIQDLYNSQLNSTFVNAGTDQTICNGDPVSLSAMNSLNYSWDNGVEDGVAFNPTTTQDYTVSADSAGCLSTDVVTVTVNEHTTATQTETSQDSYTWPINSQTYTQSGTYTAVIPNTAGCDSTITLNLSLDFTGINEFSENNLFTVFPNPAQRAINIKADNKLIGEVYSIYDNTGRVVLTGKLNAQNTTIDLGNLSGGIYMFSVGENMKQTFKIIKAE
jgi:hypothetical protein